MEMQQLPYVAAVAGTGSGKPLEQVGSQSKFIAPFRPPHTGEYNLVTRSPLTSGRFRVEHRLLSTEVRGQPLPSSPDQHSSSGTVFMN